MKNKIALFITTFFLVLSLIITAPFVVAQENTELNTTEEIENQIDGFPVTFSGEELFIIQVKIGSFTPEDRANAIIKRLDNIAKEHSIPVDLIKIEEDGETTNIVIENKVIVTLTEPDAQAARISKEELAIQYLDKIKISIEKYREERSSSYLIRSGIYSLVATLILLIILMILKQIFPRIIKFLDKERENRIKPFKIQNLELIPANKITDILIGIVKLINWIIILSIFYIYVPLVLSFFPWTKSIGNKVFNSLTSSLENIWQQFINYLPNLIVVIIISVITYYIIRLFKIVFTEIDKGKISFPWFYQEWAEPTYKLIVVLTVALSLVVIFPYLPGFDSPAFQGVSIFLGVLFSLGSTAAVSNIIGGIILIYTRSFQEGDRVKIDDSIGLIIEKTILVTRILTPKNVVITIPNSTVLNSNIINYTASSLSSHPPLILNTTITLGYDVPWRKVYTVLINAALNTENVLKEPDPFVLQTGLNDFYVSYELNCYTNKSVLMNKIYSQLHENIQDQCNENDIEILSPHYSAIRDGHHNTIPIDYLPKNYTPPTWKFESLKKNKLEEDE